MSTPDLDDTPTESYGKSRLTEAERRYNHIQSERKRRDALRYAFDRLAELTPGMSGQGRSESVVLQKVVEYAREQMQERERLMRALEAKGISMG